jgi:hypothetical protein
MAYSRLYQRYNDIDVFVEDSTYNGVYEKIINRILAGKGKVVRVTPLGPRLAVEEAARADVAGGVRPRLYIVDGDLDILAKGRVKKIPNLYRLKVYSVENLVIDVDSVKNYCRFSCPGIDEITCVNRCDIDLLFNEMDSHLIKYITALAIARRLDLDGRVSAINPPSVGSVVAGRRVGPCKDLIRGRLKEIITEAISTRGLQNYRKAKGIVLRNLARRGGGAVALAPGKLFALPYVNERVGLAGGLTLPQKAMVSYLAERAPLQNDRGFRSALKRAVKGKPPPNPIP